MLSNNPNKFWQITNPNSSLGIRISKDCEVLSDLDCANIFNYVFSYVFTTEPLMHFFAYAAPVMPSMPDVIFSPVRISALSDSYN